MVKPSKIYTAYTLFFLSKSPEKAVNAGKVYTAYTMERLKLEVQIWKDEEAFVFGIQYSVLVVSLWNPFGIQSIVPFELVESI